MSKHKALELADISEEFAAQLGNSIGHQTAAELRAQHALIVQMREALLLLMVNSSVSMHQAEIIHGPLAAADQYLKGEQA